MTGRYYTELVDVLTAAGVRCHVEAVNAGWETRARSSGGFATAPLGVVWHHTASATSPFNDVSYMVHGSDDAPIGNMLLDRDGVVWPIAAGAANTQGKGGPATFSRGTVPVDAGNSQLWGLEVANSGIGEIWPIAQIDAYFAASNALNAMFGNQPMDVLTHHLWAPDRKIDPATADAVSGPWFPRSVTTSGTWDVWDIAEECARRATPTPTPPTPPSEADTMTVVLIIDDAREPFARWRCAGNTKTWVDDGNASAQLTARLEECAGGQPSPVDGFLYRHLVHGDNDVIASYGPIVGPIPLGFDQYGRH